MAEEWRKGGWDAGGKVLNLPRSLSTTTTYLTCTHVYTCLMAVFSVPYIHAIVVEPRFLTRSIDIRRPLEMPSSAVDNSQVGLSYPHCKQQ
jgi:hypothetical protein